MSARNMLIMAPAQAAQVVVGVGAVALFTRMMSPEDFGAYAVILSCSMLAHTAALTWAEAAAYRYLPEAQRNRTDGAHFATLMALALAVGLVCAVIMLASLAIFPAHGATAAAIGFAAVWSAARFFTRIARESDRAEGRMTRYSWRETSFLMVGFALGVAFLAWTPLGVASPFAGMAAGGVLACLLDGPQLLGRARRARADGVLLVRYFAYGAPLAVGLAIELAMQTATRSALAILEGAAAAGAYAASVGAVGRALDVLFIWTALAFAPALLRAYTSGDTAATRKASAELVRGLAAVAIPATVGLCLVAGHLCDLLVGEALAREAARMAPAVVLMGLANGFSVYLIAEAFTLSQKTGLRTLLLVPAAIAHGVFLVALIGWFGPIGGAYAGAGSSLLALLLLAIFGRKLVSWRWPWLDLAKIMAASAVMAAGVWATPDHAGLAGLVIKAGVGAILYLGVVIALDMGGLRSWMQTRWRRRAAA
jgi:O-antigen/teichoic acid export membrane protein